MPRITDKRFKDILRRCVLSLPLAACCPAASAGETVEYQAEAIFNAGSGSFAPYYIASNRHGLLTQSSDALLRLEGARRLDLSRRFSYAYGAEVLTGYADKVDYLRYNPASSSFYSHAEGPCPR